MIRLNNWLLGCALLLVAGVAIAQIDELKNSTPEQRATLLTEMMTTTLSLDEKTTTAVSAINLKYATQTQALLDSDGPRLEKLMTFRRNSAAKDTEIKAVLTAEQYRLYEQKKSEMQDTVKQKIQEKYQGAQ